MSKNTDLARYSSNTISLGGIAVGSNLTITSSSVNIGNSTVNAISNSTIYTGTSLFANFASYVLANSGIASNSTGVFVKAADGLLANSTGLYVSGNSGLVVNATGVWVKANTGITANATGLFINQAFTPTWTGAHTFSANLVVSAGIIANSSIGTAGQVLTANGTSVYWATPSSGSKSWYGNVYAAYGDCDPNRAWENAILNGTVAATPTNIGTSVARIAYFRPPANITVNKVRFYGVGATTDVYQISIYNGDTLAQLSAQAGLNTASQAWGSAYDSLGLTLTANQLYFIAVSAETTGTTAGLLCLGSTIAGTTGRVSDLPKSFPGNLDIDAGHLNASFAQGAVTTGALPDPFPTVAGQAAWTGGMPLFFLDNSNA